MERFIDIFIDNFSVKSPFGREDSGKGRRVKKVRREAKGEKVRKIEGGWGDEEKVRLWVGREGDR
jgi:hypothetical protein